MGIGKQARNRSLARIGLQDKEKSTREEYLVGTAGKPTAYFLFSSGTVTYQKRARRPFFRLLNTA
jgi:hypothetical protein